MAFGEKANKNEESDEDDEDEENKDEDIDELQEKYMETDSIQKWKFNFNSVTTLVNDFPELEVKEKTTSDEKYDADNLNTPIVVAPGEGKVPTNILEEDYWDVKSFPGLHPDGRNGLHEQRDVK